MSLNSTEDLYEFVSLTKQEFPQSTAESCLERAFNIVNEFCPDDGGERVARFAETRKLAEINYAASFLFKSYAVIFFQSQPPIRVLNVLNFGAGSDSPTPTELLSSLRKLSDEYRDEAEYWLKRIKPINNRVISGS